MTMRLTLFLILILSVITGCRESDSAMQEVETSMTGDNAALQIATFAGGCFWCTEADFEKLSGVVKVVSGYTGGFKENPFYEEVSAGTTGHI